MNSWSSRWSRHGWGQAQSKTTRNHDRGKQKYTNAAGTETKPEKGRKGLAEIITRLCSDPCTCAFCGNPLVLFSPGPSPSAGLDALCLLSVVRPVRRKT